jgi:hypothetical protein
MQIMAINFNNVNVINVNDGINANNSIDVNSLQFTFFACKHNISYAISLRRYYIKSYNCNTVVPTEPFPLYCKTTNYLSI